MNTAEYVKLLESRKRQTDHAMHALLVVVTLGLWLPVWIIMDVRNDRRNMHLSYLQKSMQNAQDAFTVQGATGVEIREHSNGYVSVDVLFPAATIEVVQDENP